MATTQQKWQEIANRGLQDRFDPQTRAKFDEAVNRGLITLGDQVQQPLQQPKSEVKDDIPVVTTGDSALPVDSVQPGLTPTDSPTDLGAEALGGLDVAKTVITSAVAEPIAGLAGLISSPFVSQDQAIKNISAVREFITLEPSTEEGQRNLKVVGELVSKGVELANIPASGLVGIAELISGQGIEQATESVRRVQQKGLSSVLGQRTLDATGSPELAAVAHALPTAALEALGVKGLRSTKLANEKLSGNVATAIQQAAPDIETIKAAKNKAYNDLDNLGVRVKSETFDSFADKLSDRLAKEGINPTLTPKSTAALKAIQDAKGTSKSLSELDTLRKIAKGAANDIDKTDARLGNIIINELDSGIDRLSNEIGGKFREARGLAQRGFKSQDIADMLENATHTASGLENGLRIEARKILKNKKRRKGFTKDELSALKQIEQGTSMGNLSKFLGKFGVSENQATSMLGASIGAGGGGVIGSAFGGPAGGVVGALTVPALGQIAKKTAQRITVNNTKMADGLIRAGRNAKEVTKVYLDNTPISERSVSDLTDLLMDPNLTGASLNSLISLSPKNKVIADALFFVKEIKRRSKQAVSTAAITQPELQEENQ